MSHEKPIVIVSLGQLLETSPAETVQAFARLVTAQKKNWCCTLPAEWLLGYKPGELTVMAALGWDQSLCGKQTINLFKKGELSFEQFHYKIDRQLDIETNYEEFKTVWNKMCTITPEQIQNVKNLLDFQKQRGFELIIVSDTNHCHYDYIKHQLKQNDIDVPVVTSYANQTLDLEKLAGIGLAAKYKPNAQVFSLHNKIANAENLKVNGFSFLCQTFDSRQENIIDVLHMLLPERSQDISPAAANDDSPTRQHQRRASAESAVSLNTMLTGGRGQGYTYSTRQRQAAAIGI